MVIPLLLIASCGWAQTGNKISEMRLNLNDTGTHYLKATFLNQVWFRFNQSNPGTTVLGKSAPETFDIGLRRTRIQFYGQLTDRVFFYVQFGQNNFNYLAQNAGNRKVQVFFHDALSEYKVLKKDQLIFGGGLTITNGLSRFSQPSIGTILTMDVPIFAQATVDQTDQFSRKLSWYARGQLGRLDYRLVVSDPFPLKTNGQPLPVISANATFAQEGHSKQYQGFFAYNFLDKESHVTPYMTGTYLGKKKVFNLEAGFITQRNATETGQTDANGIVTNKEFHPMQLWSVAAFLDHPVANGAISGYLGYFNTNYGPGYLRYNGIMNPADGIVSGPATGSQGNAFPMFGTGKVVYGQLGYLLPEKVIGTANGRLLPYFSVMHANFERLSSSMVVWETGINWLLEGHTAKITLDYQSRSVYKTGTTKLEPNGRNGQWLIQYQIFF